MDVNRRAGRHAQHSQSQRIVDLVCAVLLVVRSLPPSGRKELYTFLVCYWTAVAIVTSAFLLAVVSGQALAAVVLSIAMLVLSNV